MSRRVSSLDKTTVGIDRDISSQYDNVKIVADNILDVEIVADNIGDISSAAQAAIDIAAAAAQVALDKVAVADDLVQTNQDTIDTAADAAATAADRVQTGLDVVQTGNDVVQTGNDVLQTAADVIATAADVVSIGADAAQTALDRIATAADVVSTNADAAQTALDAAATAGDAIATAADRTQTTLDAAATAADLVQTNLDQIATSSDAASTAADLLAMGTIFDNFDDRFLGSFAIDPVLDNDGNAILAGAVYYNTVDLDVRFYNGATWDAPATSATTSAAQALASKNAADADVVLTHADVVLTHADVVSTADDAIATAADRVQTGLDRVQTGLDAVATAAATSADAVATAADRVQTGLDVLAAQGIVDVHVGESHTITSGTKNIEDSVISFVDGTRTFTIEPAVDTFEILHQGVEYSFSTAQTVVIPNTVGTHFIYFAAGVLTTSMTPWNVKGADTPISVIVWNGTAGAVGNERHGMRDLAWHDWAHHTIGTRYESGFELTLPTTGTPLQLEVTGGTLHDEDLDLDTVTETVCRLWRETAAEVWTWVDGTDNAGKDYPCFYNTGTTQVQYVRLSDYTLQDVPNNDYISYFVYGSNDIDRPIYIATHAIAAPHLTKNAARNADIPTSFSQEIKLLYQLIYNGNGTLVEINDYRLSQPVPGGGTASTTAAAVSFSPTGNVASTTVQSAIAELDGEKAPIASPTFTGTVNLPATTIIGTVDATELSYLNGATSGLQAQINNKQVTISGGATTIATTDLAANRVLVSDGVGKVGASAVTSTEILYLDGVTSGIQGQLNSKAATITGAATTIDYENLTASRALQSNASGKVEVSAVTTTELGYLDGVTSGIQGQLNGKAATLTGAATSIDYENLAGSRALQSNIFGKVEVSAVTTTELGHLDGVTSGIQGQLNGKQATLTGATSNITASNFTPYVALVSDGNGKIAQLTSVSSTEMGRLDGVTSNIQTQLNTKIDQTVGTWNPTFTDLTTGVPTYSNQTGIYIKTGKMVHVNGRCAISSKGTLSGAAIYLDSFPFAASIGQIPLLNIKVGAGCSYSLINGVIVGTKAAFTVVYSLTAQASGTMSVNDVTDFFDLSFSCNYLTN